MAHPLPAQLLGGLQAHARGGDQAGLGGLAPPSQAAQDLGEELPHRDVGGQADVEAPAVAHHLDPQQCRRHAQLNRRAPRWSADR